MIRRVFSTLGFITVAASLIALLVEPRAFFLVAIAQLVALLFLLPSAHSLTKKQRRAFRIALLSIILMLSVIPYAKISYATIASKYRSLTVPAAVAELDALDRRMFFVHLVLMSVTQTCVILSSWYLLRCCWHSNTPEADGFAK